jgi:hypothetical protein
MKIDYRLAEIVAVVTSVSVTITEDGVVVHRNAYIKIDDRLVVAVGTAAQCVLTRSTSSPLHGDADACLK